MNASKTTVLVIEDDGNILRVLTTILSAGGYKVVAAVNGLDANTLISSHMPEIIFLDLGLPDTDGIDLLKTLRGWSDVPVIVISARSTEKDKIVALDHGADDYITKPFSAQELLARMRAVLRRRSSKYTIEQVFTFGGLLIDFGKRSVLVDGVPIRLTQVEYRIVEMLAREPGRVLTYSTIIERIWGPYADADNNRILRVNMSNIRRKLEKNNMSPQYILTEIGVGYRMADSDGLLERSSNPTKT